VLGTQEPARLSMPHPGIHAVSMKKIGMRAFLDDPALI
jgi:hypothetical protein